MGKNMLLKECATILQTPKVAQWYTQYLVGQPQVNTIIDLEIAVHNQALTIREALSIALIVGFQWNVNFEGVS